MSPLVNPDMSACYNISYVFCWEVDCFGKDWELGIFFFFLGVCGRGMGRKRKRKMGGRGREKE
jgi:hypothetical protein